MKALLTTMRGLARGALATLLVLMSLSALAAPAHANDDYKPTNEFERGSCVDFVASRLKALGVNRNGVLFANNWARSAKAPNGTTYFGNADNWDDYARYLGYTVDQNPTAGSVAQWDTNEKSAFPGGWKSAGPGGHVAFVTKVNGDGTINVEEYNQNGDHSYHVANSIKAPRYIHFHTVRLINWGRGTINLRGDGFLPNSNIRVDYWWGPADNEKAFFDTRSDADGTWYQVKTSVPCNKTYTVNAFEWPKTYQNARFSNIWVGC